ncbi:LEA type 2 family protein [bacterium]|nr:LEA type 2 family protein [bacterium]
MKRGYILLLALPLLPLMLGCSSVQEMVKSGIQKPSVEFVGAKMTGLSFADVDLLFDLKVTNPNVVGITLAGFDYDFLINSRSFVQGNQEEGLSIASKGESTVQIPVSLQFAEIYKTFSNFGDKDSATYEIKTGFSFELPILGTQRIPVSKSGSLPLLKLPRLSVESLKISSLGLTGVDLELNLKLDNPNAFSFNLDAIKYEFDVNNSQWLNGTSSETSRIGAEDAGNLRIPISLNFLQIGRSVYQLLNGSEPLQYRLKGEFDLGLSIPLLGQVTLPFDRTGVIPVTR